MNSFPKKTLVALALTSLSGAAFSHGYVSEGIGGVAAGRVAMCKYPTSDTNEKNLNCGSIQWEPQSVEGPEGFPEAGPRDGKIASAQSAIAMGLDEQTADRWVKRPIQAGKQTFEWTYTANHVTRTWKYYMTKQNWNPNASLSRDSFDLTPFCVIEGNMQKPPMRHTQECNVPKRDGYQVILAVWDVGDTANAFYNVIDVEFEDNNSTPLIPDWEKGGQIIPTLDLSVGDSVYTRVFDQSGENAAYRTTLEITDATLSQAKNWSHALATLINKEQPNIRAGQLVDNNFQPTFGTNPIFLKSGSGLKRVEIGYNIETPTPDYSITVDGLKDEYIISDTPTELNLTVTTEGDVDAELTVYNHHREALASWSGALKDGQNQGVALKLNKSEAGHHMLVSRIKDEQGNLVKQETLDFMLKEESVNPTPTPDDYDFVFPEGVSNYTAGTKVLAADGAVYQCKPFPYSGYCKQWTATATQFAPGTGSDWQMAWNKLD